MAVNICQSSIFRIELCSMEVFNSVFEDCHCQPIAKPEEINKAENWPIANTQMHNGAPSDVTVYTQKERIKEVATIAHKHTQRSLSVCLNAIEM